MMELTYILALQGHLGMATTSMPAGVDVAVESS